MVMIGVGVRFIARAALWATRLFYDLGRTGEPLPEGPVLVVANHPNSILDGLVVFCVAGRPVHPLARAPLFDRVIIGQVLRELGGLPVYRRQDDPAQMARNDSTFDAAVEALARGEAVLIFPEGTSHSEPEIAPLKTGAARIALRAENDSDWRLGLRIVPVGLTYRRKTRFRGQAAAFIGDAFTIESYRTAHAQDPVHAVRALTREIAAAMEGVTLQLHGAEDESLLDAAEAIYAAERGLERRRNRDDLSQRLPRLQIFSAGMAWLRAHDAQRFERLAAGVRSLDARLARLGLEEGELPETHSLRETLRALGTDGLLAAIGLPFAVVGVFAWYVPYMVPQLVLLLQRQPYERIASVKLVTALVVFPLAYAGWLVLGYRAGGWVVLALATILLPVAGLVAMHWREHWHDLRQDLRFYLLSLRKRGLTRQLRARRSDLADEIDRVIEDWEGESGRRAAL